MKKILLILFLVSSFLYAEIDERKSDVYFANGVGAVSKYSSFIQGKVEVDACQIATPSTQAYIGK